MYQKRSYGMIPRTFGGFFDDMIHTGLTRINDEVNALSTPVNIKETANAYELHVIAPGLKKEDFAVNVDKNVLTISYEHKNEVKEENTENQAKWLRTEYTVKSFKRSFTMNEKVDVAAIAARYADGVLNVTLPKKENVEPSVKEITIN